MRLEVATLITWGIFDAPGLDYYTYYSPTCARPPVAHCIATSLWLMEGDTKKLNHL